MGEIRDTEAPATVAGESAVRISMDLAPTLCAASTHLGLPVLRNVTLTNTGDETLEGLVISVRFSPAVIRDVIFTLDTLPARKEHRPELPPRVVDLEFLSRLDEATRATVTVEARSHTALVGAISATYWMHPVLLLGRTWHAASAGWSA